MGEYNKRKNRKILIKENISIVLSIIATAVSLFTLYNSLSKPVLVLKSNATYRINALKDPDGTLIMVEILNLGNQVAKNVKLTLWPLVDLKSSVDTSPVLDIKKLIKDNVLYVDIPIIPPKNAVMLHVFDKDSPLVIDPKKHSFLAGNYMVYVICDEGSFADSKFSSQIAEDIFK